VLDKVKSFFGTDCEHGITKTFLCSHKQRKMSVKNIWGKVVYSSKRETMSEFINKSTIATNTNHLMEMSHPFQCSSHPSCAEECLPPAPPTTHVPPFHDINLENNEKTLKDLQIFNFSIEIWSHIFEYIADDFKTIAIMECFICHNLRNLLYVSEQNREALWQHIIQFRFRKVTPQECNVSSWSNLAFLLYRNIENDSCNTEIMHESLVPLKEKNDILEREMKVLEMNGEPSSSNFEQKDSSIAHRKKLQQRFDKMEAILQQQNTYFVTILGKTNVGKTMICRRFIERTLDSDSTDFSSKKEHIAFTAQRYKVMRQKIINPFKIYITEDSGIFTHENRLQNAYESNSSLLTHMHMNNGMKIKMDNNISLTTCNAPSDANGYLLVFSLQDRHSFEEVKTLYSRIIQHKKSKCFPIVVVANKNDLNPRAIQPDEITKTIHEIEKKNPFIAYRECCAKNQKEVDVLFSDILQLMQKFRMLEMSKNDPKNSCNIS